MAGKRSERGGAGAGGFVVESGRAIQILECSIGHLHNLTSSKQIPFKKKGNGRLLFREADLLARANRHKGRSNDASN